MRFAWVVPGGNSASANSWRSTFFNPSHRPERNRYKPPAALQLPANYGLVESIISPNRFLFVALNLLVLLDFVVCETYTGKDSRKAAKERKNWRFWRLCVKSELGWIVFILLRPRPGRAQNNFGKAEKRSTRE